MSKIDQIISANDSWEESKHSREPDGRFATDPGAEKNPFYSEEAREATAGLTIDGHDFKRLPTTQVDLSTLSSGQSGVDSDKVAYIGSHWDPGAANELWVVRVKGHSVLFSGNHTATGALRAGKKTLP